MEDALRREADFIQTVDLNVDQRVNKKAFRLQPNCTGGVIHFSIKNLITYGYPGGSSIRCHSNRNGHLALMQPTSASEGHRNYAI